MESLYRIASALGTTPQALLGLRRPDHAARVVRADDPGTPTIDTAGESLRRLLLPGDTPFHVVELRGLATDFLDAWTHDGFEALYVVAGPVEVDIGGTITALATGDFMSFPAHLPHRYRSSVGSEARLLLIETQLHAPQQGAHSAEAATAP